MTGGLADEAAVARDGGPLRGAGRDLGPGAPERRGGGMSIDVDVSFASIAGTGAALGTAGRP